MGARQELDEWLLATGGQWRHAIEPKRIESGPLLPVTLARNAQDQERLIELVRMALAQIDAGLPVEAARLCAQDPHLAAPLAEVLGLQEQLPMLQQAALREDPLAGALLAGRYRLGSCLGRGAMGVVYDGVDQELQRAVAVKILDVRLFRDPEAERRFQREAEALAALQHANVVAVFDRGRTPEGIHFLVMERLVGGTWARLLERIGEGVPPLQAAAELGDAAQEAVWPRLVAKWGAELAGGLAAAHERKLVHRDVKPSNVFLAQGGRVVLLDFGIAARADDQRLTATQTTLGTPWYMAPEQVGAGGIGTAEPTLDVYGLGASLFHLLAGRAPYEGDAAAVLAALQNSDPPSLLVLRPELPRDLAAIVDRCLERQPARRYASAHALAADLRAFLHHQPVMARPLGPLARRFRAWRRAPARPLAVASLATTLLVAGIALPFVWRQQAEARQREKAELLATLPSLLAVEGWPEERLVADLAAEHRAGIELLDRILSLDPADLAMRLFRACLRLDLGDRPGAAADFAAIVAQDSSPYLRALAGRYAHADQGLQGAKAIDTKELPAPVSAIDCYVAGFHELRASDVAGFAKRADELLARAAATYLPARDLRLLSLAALADRSGGEAVRQLARQIHDETIVLETLYGRPTARTCAMRGVAFLLLKDYRASVEPLEQSLALRPGRHGPHQNLAVAWLNLGNLERSEHHLGEALRVRPFAWNTKLTYAQWYRERRDFAAARTCAMALPKVGQRGEAWKQPDLLGSIELAEAMALRRDDVARSLAAARAAVVAYDESIAVRDRPDARQKRATAMALLEERPGAALFALAEALLADPGNPHQLANLAFLLPTAGLDPAQTAWLGAVLRKLAWQGAPGDDALRARMAAEIAEVLRPYRPGR